LASAIGEPGQSALVDQGSSLLISLLGGKTLSALTGAVGQYAGLNSSGSKSLMGLLGPVVLGVLGQQQRSGGLDASGLANLLLSQKSNVAGALPSGFSKYLGDTDIGTSSAKYASRAPSTPPSVWPWLLGVLVALGALALLWHLLSGRGQHVADTTKPPVEKTTSPVGEAPYAGLLTKLQGIKAGDTDVGQLATSAVNDLYSSLVGIKDETSAQASLAGLTKASSEFDQLSGLLSQLSPENRKGVGGHIRFDKIQPGYPARQGSCDPWRGGDHQANRGCNSIKARFSDRSLKRVVRSFGGKGEAA
jgi:hypothetical protein